MQEYIRIRGARTNNLKNINLDIPRDKLIVFTGLSGSGKSSLAFDTIFAEGQRRYVESLSSYARQFLGQMDKPDVDAIDGLSPAVSIDQKTTSKNPRSTVGTVTEIYDYLRLLWARVGVPHCPVCGKEIRQQSIDQIVDQTMLLPDGTRMQILAPVVRHRKGEHLKVLEDARRGGYVRVRIDGSLYDLSDDIKLKKNVYHDIDVVIDRLVMKRDIVRRLTDSIETALALSGGIVHIDLPQEERQLSFSQNYACEDCGVSIEELTPRLFSFNSPYGACPKCTGLGSLLRVSPSLIMPNPSLSIMDGGILASGWGNVRGDSICRMYYEALAKKYHFSLSDPIRDIPEAGMNALLYWTGDEPLKLRYERGNGYGILEKPSKSGTIVLTGWMEDGDIVLLISDDGVGIAPDKLPVILSGEGTSISGGTNIAIYNTHRRLQVLYGADYGLTYSSDVGKGTEVQIRIPAKRDETSGETPKPL